MKRRNFLQIFGASAVTAALLPNLPSLGAEGDSYELVIQYNMQEGYMPSKQKINLLKNGKVFKSWKCTSSRTIILTTEEVAEGLLEKASGFQVRKLIRKSNRLPRANNKKGQWGFEIHQIKAGRITIHPPLGNGGDEIGSLLCFRTFGFETLRKVITALQKAGYVIPWRIEHLL
jgi:hypothetical protein